MNAEQALAYINSKYPSAMASPLAQLFATVTATDAAERAIGFACLQARATVAQIREDAISRAESCLDACDGWTVETLSSNIEEHIDFRLETEECDAIAEAAMQARGFL
jgi:hypothetical protein